MNTALLCRVLAESHVIQWTAKCALRLWSTGYNDYQCYCWWLHYLEHIAEL